MAASPPSPRPPFVFVSGRPGAGRQGLFETRAGAADEAAPVVDGSTSFRVFHGALDFRLRAGVSLVAEASLQRRRDEPSLRPLVEAARGGNVRWGTSIEEATRRFVAREAA